MNPQSSERRHHSGALCRAWLLALWALGLCALPAPAQTEETAEQAAHPSGVARLTVDGRQVSAVPFSLAPQGPLVALSPIAAVLGVELRIGPLGDSHRLIFADKEVIVGPAQSMMITVQGDADRQEQISTFSRPPIKAAGGLQVPLDFLAATLGDELGYEFAWNATELRLDLTRREVRELTASIDVVHQHSSTVEIRFSEPPRYRVERRPGALVIHLVGDLLKQPVSSARTRSPLVRHIAAAPDHLRIDLADDAGAAEPRLLVSPVVRLIVEVFHRSALPEEAIPGAERRPPARASGVRTIVIDPGHGGAETGAIGPSGTAEKNLTLLVSRVLKRQLERRLPVRVVLTRTGDVELPLETRTSIANQNKADLFISLHCNSAFGATAHGAETYFLSREASDQMAAQVAEMENLANGGAQNPELDLQLILWDLAQSYHLAESQRFASLVQEELNLTLGLRDRGVKQAPFRVLMGAMMPAVLVELGFLSNPEEETKLQTSLFRGELADSLVRAVIRFKTQMEAREDSADAVGELP
ncbi:MAG: N-acetylmuramoyl-L-alanine amidase [bacterium]|nr:N-acetylmuramoyl-L-alanine amidase [bacterium]